MTFPTQFNVTGLNGRNGFAFINDLGDQLFGDVVSNLGDVNHDGKSDLIVASMEFSNQAYVLFGADSFPSRLYTSVLNGKNGFRIVGTSQTNALGCATVGLGDVNGDGIDDFIVGSCYAPLAISEAYVVFGARSFPSRVSLANLNGKNGFKITGYVSQGFINARSIGDINGDGMIDFILGKSGQAPDYNLAFVVYGASEFPTTLSLLSLDGANGFTIVGTTMNLFEAQVAGIGDFNQDSRPDFLIGIGWVQQAAVIYGAAHFPAVFNISNLSGMNGFIIVGMHGYQANVAAVGDINGDHFPDLGIGFFDMSNAFLIFGARHFNATFNISGLHGSNGVRLIGFANSDFGIDIDGTDSLNHNGKSSVIIGASQIDSSGAGSAFVFFGTDQFPPEFHASDLNGTNGFEIVGLPNSLLGCSVASIDNFTGTEDIAIIIGAPMQNTTYIILDV